MKQIMKQIMRRMIIYGMIDINNPYYKKYNLNNIPYSRLRSDGRLFIKSLTN